MSTKDLSIITVTWNSSELIGEQIQSVLLACKKNSFEQIVIDNASADNTVSFIKEKYQHVHVIANTENKGFGVANNQGVNIANGKFFLFLNPDMRLYEGTLDTMVQWMESHSDVGIASVKLVDEKGNLNYDAQPRRFPRLWEQLALILKLPHIFPFLLNAYMMKGFDADKEQSVDSVRGSFMLMRRELVQQLGWAFDPRYYIWYEDVDICREAHRLGYKVVHTPIISCVDYVGQSFKKRDTLWKQKNFTRSMLVYYKKWEKWYVWIWIALFRPLGILFAWLNDLYAKTKHLK